MSGLEILSLTPGATIQDRGRAGQQRLGVWEGGAMDAHALAEGQALLGNGADDAALELPGAGGRFRAHAPMVLATSGADMALTVAGRPVPWRSGFAVAAGEEIFVGAATVGVYGYLHAAGGFLTDVHLGSRSTHLRAGLGTVPEAGMLLPVGPEGKARAGLVLPRPAYFTKRTIRVMRGPQTHLFDDEVVVGLFSARLTVSPTRDRMGMRVISDHGPITSRVGQSVLSDAILPGDIQATADGMPAMLLADRGTTGGYPRIATVAGADIPALVQMPVGTAFGLVEVGHAEARTALVALRREMTGLAKRAKPLTRDPGDVDDLLSLNLVSGVVKGDEDDER